MNVDIFIKKCMYYDRVDFNMKLCKLINILIYMNRFWNENDMIILIYVEKNVWWKSNMFS